MATKTPVIGPDGTIIAGGTTAIDGYISAISERTNKDGTLAIKVHAFYADGITLPNGTDRGSYTLADTERDNLLRTFAVSDVPALFASEAFRTFRAALTKRCTVDLEPVALFVCGDAVVRTTDADTIRALQAKRAAARLARANA